MIEVIERKRKVEAALGAVDVRSQLLVESAVRKDIEVYKDRHAVADVANFIMMTADSTQAKLKEKAKQ
jgi:hypothetical protein